MSASGRKEWDAMVRFERERVDVQTCRHAACRAFKYSVLEPGGAFPRVLVYGVPKSIAYSATVQY